MFITRAGALGAAAAAGTCGGCSSALAGTGDDAAATGGDTTKTVGVCRFCGCGCGVIVEAKDGKVIAANMWGKVKTVLQMLSIIFYFFGMSIASMSATGAEQGVRQILVISISMVLCWLVAAVTAISGIKYLWDNRSFINTAK